MAAVVVVCALCRCCWFVRVDFCSSWLLELVVHVIICNCFAGNSFCHTWQPLLTSLMFSCNVNLLPIDLYRSIDFDMFGIDFTGGLGFTGGP